MLTSPIFSLSTFVPQHTSIINLSRNELTYLNADYADMWVDGLNQLVLCHNNIEQIYADSFKKLLSLEALDLSYNKISFLQSDAFSQLKSLQTLDLSHNLLPRIDGFWFQGPRQLIRLNLSYNKIGIFWYKSLNT
jgi:Leucine-rich repeat (LRR) protein